MATNEYGYVGAHAPISAGAKSGVFTVNDQKVLDDDSLWTSEGVTDGRVFYIDAANSASYSGSGNSVTDIDNSVAGANSGSQTLYSSDGGGSFYFNGTGGIDFPDITALNTLNKTIIVWVKANPAQTGFLFEKGAVNTQYSFFFNSSTTMYFRSKDTNPDHDMTINPSTHFSSSAYTMAIAWQSGTSKRIYKNGSILVTSGTTGSGDGTTNSSGIRVGEYNGNGYLLTGYIGLVKVFNRGLTAAEMDLEYDTYKTRFGL